MERLDIHGSMAKKKKKKKNKKKENAASQLSWSPLESTDPCPTPTVPDQQWTEYCNSLRTLVPSMQTHYVRAVDLGLSAFRTVGVEAASLLSNAFLIDDRACSHVLIHIAATTCEGDYRLMLETFVRPMLAHFPKHATALTCNVLLYWTHKITKSATPTDLLEYLNKCTTYINDCQEGSPDLDHATILKWQAAEFFALGRVRKSIRLLRRAAHVGNEGLVGLHAVYQIICINSVGVSLSAMKPDEIAQNVIDLQYIWSRLSKRDRESPDVLQRLSTIFVVCGDLEQAQQYRALYEESQTLVAALHPPQYQMTMQNTFFLQLWTTIDAGSVPTVNEELKTALANGATYGNADKEDGDGDNQTATTLSDDFCIVCGASAKEANKKSLLKCGGCKVVQYCGKPCQTSHWKVGGHQKECKRMHAAATSVGTNKKKPIVNKSAEKLTQQQRKAKFRKTTGCKATTSTVRCRKTQRKWIRQIMKEPGFSTWWLEASPAVKQQRLRSRLPDMPKQESHGPGSSLTPFLTVDFLCSECNCGPNRAPDVAHKGKSWFLHLLSELGSEKILHAPKFTTLDLCWSRYMGNSKAMFLSGKIKPNYSGIYSKKSVGLPLRGKLLNNEDVGIGDWTFTGVAKPKLLLSPTSHIGQALKQPDVHRMGWSHAWDGAERARTAWHFLAMAMIEQYLDDTHRMQSSSTLAIRSHGCVVCSKELPLLFDPSAIGSGGPMPCTTCYNVAWCSQKCKNKQKDPHAFDCLGTTCHSQIDLLTLHQNM